MRINLYAVLGVVLLAFQPFSINLWAQIVAPDTVCVGETVQFATPVVGNNYTYYFGQTQLDFSGMVVTGTLANAPLSGPAFMAIVEDQGNWHGFVTNYWNNELIHLDFGNNPHNTPLMTSLGRVATTIGYNVEGVDVVQDPNTSDWHVFVVKNQELIRLDFGPSLNNTTPTKSAMNFGTFFSFPHQLNIKKVGNEWIAFVANRYGTITRLDFGTSITATPTATNLPLQVQQFHNPCNFALYEQAGNWYMLVSSLENPAELALLTFGTNLKNNTPTARNLGNPGGHLNVARGITIYSGCDQLYAFVITEHDGKLVRFDFQNDITNVPTASVIGTFPQSGSAASYNGLTPYIFNNEMNMMLVGVGYNTILNLKVFDFPVGATTSNNSAITRTFTQPGIYNVTLYVDQGSLIGPYAFCKKIVVQDIATNVFGDDTLVCDATAYRLEVPPGADTYEWSTGANSNFIDVTQSGTYWVKVLNSNGCNILDTITITFGASPLVQLDNDTTICQGDSVIVHSIVSPSNVIYRWNNGASTPSIRVFQSGNYILEVDDGYCKGRDTFVLSVNPSPNPNLGQDTAFCDYDFPILLTPLTSPPVGTQYSWYNGSNDTAVLITQGGKYWLQLKSQQGCTSSDTVTINLVEVPALILRDDTSVCAGTSVRVGYEEVGLQYRWSTGAVSPYIDAASPGIYTLEIIKDGCAITDTFVLNHLPTPVVDLGLDSIICASDFPVVLRSKVNGSASYTYRWNDETSDSTLKVTQSGTYWLEVKNAQGCAALDTITLRQIDLPSSFLPPDTTICFGDTLLIGYDYPMAVKTWNTGATAPFIKVYTDGTYVLTIILEGCTQADTLQLTTSSVPPFSLGADKILCPNDAINLTPEPEWEGAYTWSTGDTARSLLVTRPGRYTLHVSNRDGCSNADTILINTQELPIVSLGEDTSLCSGSGIVLSPTLYHADIVKWSDGTDGPELSVNTNGQYVVTAENECGTAADSILVTMKHCDIWLPTAFTPNGDGLNDVYSVLGSIQDLTEFHFSIWNRWGQCVFFTDNPMLGWAGQFKGADMPVGVYYYVLEYGFGGQKMKRKGDVHLVR